MRQAPIIFSIALVFVCTLVEPVVSHARQATPGLPDLPAETAPLGLGTVSLPADAEGVAALFAWLPAVVAGEHRTAMPDNEGLRVVAAYGTVDSAFGPPLILQAMDFATGDFFPLDFTAADFVATAADTPDYEAAAFGQDGTLVWVRAETTTGVSGDKPGTPTVSRVIHTLAWGNATSSWLFTAAAFSPEGLDALVSAFVATAESQPGTPVSNAPVSGSGC